MPPGSYRLMNPDARLTDAEQDALIDGLLRTVRANQDPPLPETEGESDTESNAETAPETTSGE